MRWIAWLVVLAAGLSGCTLGGSSENGGVPAGATHAEVAIDKDFAIAAPATSTTLTAKLPNGARSAFLNVTIDGATVGAQVDGPGSCKQQATALSAQQATFSGFCGALPAGDVRVTITVQAGAPTGHVKLDAIVSGLLPSS